MQTRFSHLPPLRLVWTTRYAPHARMPRHCDGRPRLSMVLAGRLRETAGRREAEAGALCIAAKSADAVHATQFGPEGAVVASIDLAGLAGAESSTDLGQTVPDWRWTSVRELHAQRRALIAALVEVRNFPDSDSARDGLGEHVRLVLDALRRDSAREPVAPSAWLEMVRARIDDAPDEPVTVAVLARQAGVSPTHLTRRFHAAYGCPVTSYRSRRRIQRALQRLAAPGVRLVDVAIEAGFHDQSHFTHHFRALTGTTPGAWRTRLLAA